MLPTFKFFWGLYKSGIFNYIKSNIGLSGELQLMNKINVFKFSFFMFQIVFQNAEDIARESDRKRSFKSYQRNSWSSDLRRNARSDIISRPLSTGALLVCHYFDLHLKFFHWYTIYCFMFLFECKCLTFRKSWHSVWIVIKKIFILYMSFKFCIHIFSRILR